MYTNSGKIWKNQLKNIRFNNNRNKYFTGHIFRGVRLLGDLGEGVHPLIFIPTKYFPITSIKIQRSLK